MASPSTRPALLLLLQGSPALQKMLAAWPNVFDRLKRTKPTGPRARMLAWRNATGLRDVEIAQGERVLFRNGFCSETDGTVDPLAERYLASIAVAGLPRQAKKLPDA